MQASHVGRGRLHTNNNELYRSCMRTIVKIRIHLLALLAIAMLATGCRGVEKFLQPDERVLNRNIYEVVMTDSSEVPDEINAALKGMKKYARQTPNTPYRTLTKTTSGTAI